MQPLILLSAGRQPNQYSARRAASVLYGEAVAKAGGLPAIFAGGEAEALAERFSGLLLIGGGDVDPARYGAQRLPTDEIDETRDVEEFALADAFIRRERPVFGICRGIQLLNVYFGGTLRQHIPDHADGVSHAVTAVPGSRIETLCGGAFLTNSWHHQAVGELARGLRATAASADGTAEAVEHESLPVFAVQWHPERMIAGLCADVPTDHLRLFAHFVGLCRAQPDGGLRCG